MALQQRPYRDLQPLQERSPQRHRARRHDPNAFFGIEKMSLKAQATVGLAVTVPIVLIGTVLFGLTAEVWLYFAFIFGWAIFPASGLLLRRIAGLTEGDAGLLDVTSSKERELLTALREHGELTPARAAMETSLTVAEADEILKGLVECGHLNVRVRGGGLFYALWEAEGAALEPGERV